MQLTSAGILFNSPRKASNTVSATVLAHAFDDQARIFLDLGLQSDASALTLRLQAVGAVRLADYAEFFKEGGCYRVGTTLEMVWRLHEFDRRLRLLCLEGIAWIEVHTRTQLAYCFAHQYGNLSYLNESNFPNFNSDRDDFDRWQRNVHRQISNARALGVLRNDQSMPTIQALVEFMDFGAVLSFFRGVHLDMRKSISDAVEQPDEVVMSWLRSLRPLRNFCAHHHRVWNWSFNRNGVKIPQRKKFPEWHSPRLPNNRMGIFLTICRYWLNRIQPDNDWSERVFALFDTFPEVPASAMGFPENWRRHPLWVN